MDVMNASSSTAITTGVQRPVQCVSNGVHHPVLRVSAGVHRPVLHVSAGVHAAQGWRAKRRTACQYWCAARYNER
eukprot:1014924-Rhodomonas_salina.1